MKAHNKFLFYSLFILIFVFSSCKSDVPEVLLGTKGTVTDIDGNVYQTITIGTQTWMIENLRSTRYLNGDSINRSYMGDTTFYIHSNDTLRSDTIHVNYNGAVFMLESKKDKDISLTYDVNSIFVSTKGETFTLKRNSQHLDVKNDLKFYKIVQGASCNYNQTINNDSIVSLGKLYNYYAATDSRKIAPQNWHVPSRADWLALVEYVKNNPGSSKYIAKALAGVEKWNRDTLEYSIGYDLSLNNSSGFTAMPTGIRRVDGQFEGIGKLGQWWSSTAGNDTSSSWMFNLTYSYSDAFITVVDIRKCLSIRCVKD
ncbi:MAG: fibrobacter succinogenes major paralogous domain-containing protein [Paludibacter sp.]